MSGAQRYRACVLDPISLRALIYQDFCVTAEGRLDRNVYVAKSSGQGFIMINNFEFTYMFLNINVGFINKIISETTNYVWLSLVIGHQRHP